MIFVVTILVSLLSALIGEGGKALPVGVNHVSTVQRERGMTELNFRGKEFVRNHHLTVPFRPLVPQPEKGIGPVDLSGNLIIHGDNLHALKALMPMYAGKVDVIFIDPPYNTGNEGWAYNDNVNSPMIKEWLGKEVGIDDALRHDKWCAMMWPRLMMLSELLAPHGMLWITLDHNEIDNAKAIVREIFGSGSIKTTICTEANPRGRQSDTDFATVNDYLLCVAKYPEETMVYGVKASDDYIDEFSEFDPEIGHWRELGLRQRGSDSLREDREDMFFPIYVDPTDGSVSLSESSKFNTVVVPKKSDGREGRWSWSPKEVQKEIARVYGRKVKGRDKNIRFDIFYKDPLNREGEQRTQKPKTIWDSSVANTEQGSIEVTNVFGEKKFQYPKPRKLLERILQISLPLNGLVLDSFAGSATTAHACLALNKADGGNRKFIAIEMEEYADYLTAERVRRVVAGYSHEGKVKEELLTERITFSIFSKADKLLNRISAIENLESLRFDEIKKEIRNGNLIVTGEKKITEKVEGLGGTFTFCELGPPINLDAILKGEQLPTYEALGSALFHMITNTGFDPKQMAEGQSYLGSSATHHVWMLYKPDLDWLKSPAAALTLDGAKVISASKADGKTHYVISATRYVSDRLLREENIPVEFVPLPYALYRIGQA